MDKRALILVLLLGGCVQPISPPVTPQKLVALLVQITQADLATTIQIAASVSPPDLESIQCARFLQDFIPTLSGPSHTFIPPTGIASTFETLRIGAMQATSGIGMSASQHQALDIACGPIALSTEYMFATGAITISGAGPSAFVQMLLALGKANL